MSHYPQNPYIHQHVRLTILNLKSGQNMSVFFNFKEASGNLRLNVTFKSGKKISSIFFKENLNFLNLSDFLYNSYGARLVFNIFVIV